jgi:hypothetical protein
MSYGCLPKEIIFENTVKRAYPILPIDLLSLMISAAVIGDADLINAAPHLRDLCGDFRLKTEPILLNQNALDDLSPERLVAGLHICEIYVCEHI